jgi:Cu(I)/Ag(I) efflux system membrane fusion protein
VNSDSPNGEAIQSGKEQLLLFGMSESQVDNLLKTKKLSYRTSLYASSSGHIHEMKGENDLTMPNMEMPNKNKTGKGSSGNSGAFSIQEGMYLEKGQIIFSIVSTEKLWAILKIYPEDVPKVKVHQKVDIVSEMHPGKMYNDHIDFLEPSYDVESKHLTARVYLENCDHHELKIGSLVKARIQVPGYESLWVPKQAVLDLGAFQYVVFLKKEEAFTAQKVHIGNRVGDNVEIKKGLTKEDQIASDAQYLVDSEGFVSISQ